MGINDVKQLERENKKRNTLYFVALGILFFVLILSFFFALLIDSSGLEFFDMLKGLFRVGSKKANIIIGNIRLRRVIASLLVGTGLTLSGAIMQYCLNNPMASPSTLGVSEAATFGATIALVIFSSGNFSSNTVLSITNPYLVSTCSFIMALIAILIVLFLSKFKGFSPSTVALCGIALGGLFSSLTAIVQYFSSDSNVASTVYWTFGDLSRPSFLQLGIMAAIIIPSIIIFLVLSRRINALMEGEEVAKSLGIRTNLLRFICLLLASLICAVTVSFVGIIGFIGLVVPQIVSRLIGDNASKSLPLTALIGSISMLLLDALSRVLVRGTNLPVGSLTTLIGAPVFIYILLTSRRQSKWN